MVGNGVLPNFATSVKGKIIKGDFVDLAFS